MAMLGQERFCLEPWSKAKGEILHNSTLLPEQAATRESWEAWAVSGETPFPE